MTPGHARARGSCYSLVQGLDPEGARRLVGGRNVSGGIANTVPLAERSCGDTRFSKDRLCEIQISPATTRYCRRKFSTKRGPCSVRKLSGWNCTPSSGNEEWRMPINSSLSVQAVTSNSSERVLRSMHRE